MDYRNAAGRNWAHDRPRRRPTKLGANNSIGPVRLPETLPAPGQCEHRNAAGRNWARERPGRRRVELTKAPTPIYPQRERGGGDRDVPYSFSRPSAAWTFPFTTREFGRLLAMRGRLGDGELADDRLPHDDGPALIA